MAKNIIQVLVYQIGNIPHDPAISVGIAVKSMRGAAIPLTPTGNQAGYTGQKTANSKIQYRVYAAIPVLNPSNAGVTDYFTNKTVADIVADINT